MKTIVYVTTLIYAALFAFATAQAEQATVKIHVHVTDDKGNPVEGATVEFISEHKGVSEPKGPKKTSKNKKSAQIPKTDAKGVVVVSCPGRLKVVGKDILRELVSLRGEFLVTSREFGRHTKPFRTFHLPQRENGRKSSLKIILKK